MMDVAQIPPHAELNDFFTFLYEDTSGYVYSATKDPTGGAWQQYFFKWPEQKEELITHVRRNSGKLEVYSSPSLFRNPEATKEAWLGSHVVWAEFDYGVDGATGRVPLATLRIRSSTDTHEHWYWRLGHFEDSIENFEKCSRRIAYAIGADLGTWNANRVLRPPGTLHHESGRIVEVIDHGSQQYGLHSFVDLPDPPTGEVQVSGDLPEIIELLAQYKWPTNVFSTFRMRSVENGERSDRLCWLAYECADMGMSNNEILAVLINADERWKKFLGRNDRIDQLTAIIARARIKYPTGSFQDDNVLPVMGSSSFVAQNFEMEWVIEDLLPRKAMAVIVSPPSVGKTQLSLQIAIHMALGRPFLCFNVNRPFRTVFNSLEMNDASLHYFLSQMYEDKTREELAILETNLLIMPLGHSLYLDKIADQLRVTSMVDKWEPDGLIVDSLTTSVSESTSDETAMGRMFDFYKREINVKRNMFVWGIHHPRKSQVGNRHPRSLDDVRGSGVITANADLVLSIWSDSPDDTITVESLKTRMSKPLTPFTVKRIPGLNFAIQEEGELPSAKAAKNGAAISY